MALGVAWTAAVIAESRVRRLEKRTAADGAARGAMVASDHHVDLLAEVRRAGAMLGAQRVRKKPGARCVALLAGGAVLVLASFRARRGKRD